jgi:hypothetical protein
LHSGLAAPGHSSLESSAARSTSDRELNQL